MMFYEVNLKGIYETFMYLNITSLGMVWQQTWSQWHPISIFFTKGIKQERDKIPVSSVHLYIKSMQFEPILLRVVCNCIVTRVRVYDEILPEPEGNAKGGARRISFSITSTSQYFLVLTPWACNIFLYLLRFLAQYGSVYSLGGIFSRIHLLRTLPGQL